MRRGGCLPLAGLLGVFAVAGLGAGCAQKQDAAPPQFAGVAVKTVALEPVDIPDESEYLATLKSRHSVILNPQVDGQITQIFVKSGARVAAGAPLIQIDPLAQQALVASQQAARASQQANVQYALAQWERAQKLYAAGVTSKQDYDQAKTTYDAAVEQLKALDAQLRQQQVQLHYYRVVAPTDGIVGDIPVRVGDRVTTATQLTTVDQPGSLELYVNVPLERQRDLRLGQTVQLLDAAGDVIGQTRTDFISPEVDTSTQSILVKATVRNSSDALRTAQFVRARIVWGTHRGLVVPVLAVDRINGQFFVFVVVKQASRLAAHQVLVHLGGIHGSQYEVLDGLKPGDRVVVEGMQELAEGVPVVEAASAPGGNPSR
ncbi:MAG TPA: efflux RND transporter periplasmic adaptor subunit [Candidatus Acidoferrales bacterium]|nr:efflux RND transporter periplasmic adaptor subunit [Candidatus Acidoferrales bacterium]